MIDRFFQSVVLIFLMNLKSLISLVKSKTNHEELVIEALVIECLVLLGALRFRIFSLVVRHMNSATFWCWWRHFYGQVRFHQIVCLWSPHSALNLSHQLSLPLLSDKFFCVSSSWPGNYTICRGVKCKQASREWLLTRPKRIVMSSCNCSNCPHLQQ